MVDWVGGLARAVTFSGDNNYYSRKWLEFERGPYCLNYNYYYKKGPGIIREVSPYECCR